MKTLIIISGATRGLGAALLANSHSLNHVHIIVVGRNLERIHVDSNKISLCTIDLKNPLSIVNNLNVIKQHIDSKQYNRIVFFNNAGVINPIGCVGQLDEIEMLNAISVNYISPVFFVNKIIKLIDKNKLEFHIVNISSGAADHSIRGWGMYCSTKAAIRMYFDTLESEQKNVVDGITSNIMCKIFHEDPGVMDTDMQEQIRNVDNPCKFPDLLHFQDFKINGVLKLPDSVAKKLIKKYI